MDDKDEHVYNEHYTDEVGPNFTNVSNLAHQTKKKTTTPPPSPPPPPERIAITEQNISSRIPITSEPPVYDITAQNNNEYYGSEKVNIPIDSEIQNRIQHSLNQQFDSPSPIYNVIDNYNYDEKLRNDNSVQNRVDFYTDINKMVRREGEPGVILPLRHNLLESYLASIIMIYAQIPRFRNIVLGHEYLTFPYKPNWWNRERCSENPLLVQELQRLVAFLSESSHRSFASLFNIIGCFSKLQTEDIESLADFQEFIFSEICSLLTSANYSAKAECESLFKMYCITDNGSDKPHEIHTIPIQVDTVRPFLYETIYSCLFQNEERIFLMKLSDIIPITFEEGMNNLSVGFTVEETFYPQIYTYEHANILMNIDDEIENIKLKQRELNQKGFQLRAFGGKSVHRFLNETKNHLFKESVKIGEKENNSIDLTKDQTDCSNTKKYTVAGQNIEMVSSHIRESLKKIETEIKTLNERISFLQASKFNINQLLTPDMKKSLEPWILTGIIFNPTQFYYRERGSSSWISVAINDETCKEYAISTMDFADVQENVSIYTREEFSDGMILIYVRESLFLLDDFSPLNRTLQSFIAKDNDKLKEQMDTLHIRPSMDESDTKA
jgi:hypothetical protein